MGATKLRRKRNTKRNRKSWRVLLYQFYRRWEVEPVVCLVECQEVCQVECQAELVPLLPNHLEVQLLKKLIRQILLISPFFLYLFIKIIVTPILINFRLKLNLKKID